MARHGLSQGNSARADTAAFARFRPEYRGYEDRFDRLVRAARLPLYFGLAHSMGGKYPCVWCNAIQIGCLLWRNQRPCCVALPPLLNFIAAIVMPLMIAVMGGDRWNPMDPLSRTPENPPRNNAPPTRRAMSAARNWPDR